MAADMNFDQFLDAKGMSCPLPILKTKKAVEATDPGSKNDMAPWAKRAGNEIVRMDEGLGMFTFYIKKTT